MEIAYKMTYGGATSSDVVIATTLAAAVRKVSEAMAEGCIYGSVTVESIGPVRE